MRRITIITFLTAKGEGLFAVAVLTPGADDYITSLLSKSYW